jgi:DNA-binding response OmpR family regulator
VDPDENLPGVVALALDGDQFDLAALADALDHDSRVVRVLRARHIGEALALLNAEPVDIVFTETKLDGDLSGMDLSRVLSAMVEPPPFVFVTSTGDESLAAFEVGALDYVLKPPEPARLALSIDRFQAQRGLRYTDRVPLESGPGRVFLCHAPEDEERATRLYERLVGDGVQCWMEAADLAPGQDRDQEIRQAVQRSRHVLACVSRRSMTDRGYLRDQLDEAVRVADQQPEGATFLLPVRLEACPIPQRLARWHWVDLFASAGYERLLGALRVQPRR